MFGRELLPGIMIADGCGRSMPDMEARFLDIRERAGLGSPPALIGGLDLDRERESAKGDGGRPEADIGRGGG